MLEFLRARLAELLNERAELAAKRDAVLAAPTAENRDLTEDEAKAFEAVRSEIVAKDEEINELRARISNLEEDEKRQANVDKMAAELGNAGDQRNPARVTNQPETYRRGGPRSYFRDLVQAQVYGSREAVERLIRSDREVADQIKQRALNTTAGTIGEFVPPLWMVDEYVRLARAGRVIADQLRHQDLPTGTNSINLPKLLTGTATAQQTTQNTSVQNTDATSGSVTATVATLAGQQVVSLQLIEQSPINMDEVLLTDLGLDLATKIDIFSINNNAANQVGLLNVSGINSVSGFTGTSLAALYPKVADSAQRIATLRFLPAQKIFMHPRRWAWAISALDTANRPLVVPTANMPMNAMADLGDTVNAEGFVGTMQGFPIFQDPNIPTNLGAGTNEDRVIVARTDDIILYEGTVRAEVFRETKADQLSVLLRIYNYVALQSARYPQSISVISGTGLTPPTF